MPGTSTRSGVDSARSTTSTRCAPTVRESPARVPSQTSAAAVDEQHPVAEPLDVAHVVGGQQQGGAVLAALGDEELAQPLLGEHVEADRRLVEDHQAGGVQQGGRHLGAHPLARGRAAARAWRGTRSARGARPARRCARSPRRGRGRGSRRGSRTTRAPGGPTTAGCAGRRRRRPRGPACAGRAPGCSPQVVTVPRVGTRIPQSILMVVDLPGAVGADVADRLAGLDARWSRSSTAVSVRRRTPSRTLKSRPSPWVSMTVAHPPPPR